MALSSKGNLLADRYRVLGRLGAGGMAVVVLAEDERLGRKVAVKRLHAESPDDAARRFEREAKLGASLNHPNIVAVYDIATDDEGVLIVMEYVDGRTLRMEMDGGPMDPARVIEVLCGVAAGLDHAHEQGVVHRDVKPANVLIADRDGAVKLTDLGIATAAERTHITRSGVVLGTAAYMAPERLDGQAGGPPVDVYATAAMAFEMLSGRKAVTGRTAIEVARRVMEAPPADLAEALPGTPPRAAAVLKRGLAKDPAERPPSAGELVRELSAAYAEAAAREREPTGATRPLAAAAEPAAVVERVASTREPSTPSTRERVGAPTNSGRSTRWLLPALAAVIAAVVVAILLVAGGDSGDDQQAARDSGKAAEKEAREPSAAQAAPAEPEQPTTERPAPPAGDAPSGSPTEALAGFYTLAANDQFDEAWAQGTDNLHAQFGGSIDTFRGTLASLESIEFPQLSVASQDGGSATVSFSSLAHHTDRTDSCSGQATLVAQGSQWLVDRVDVQCASDGGKPAKPEKPAKPKKAEKGETAQVGSVCRATIPACPGDTRQSRPIDRHSRRPVTQFAPSRA
jgi:predicted Ser/Thr protein kinase